MRADALREWRLWRERFPETGRWPLLVTSQLPFEDDLRLPVAAPAICREQETYAAALGELDLDDWLARWRLRWGADYEGGSWRPETGYAEDGFCLLETEREIALALVPAAEPWEVARYLPAGLERWRHGESTPLVRGRLLRRWHRRWRAEVVATDLDACLELAAVAGPTTREEATALAWEQIAYCDDMLDDQTLFHRERGRPEMLLDDLASALTRSRVWWLWWD